MVEKPLAKYKPFKNRRHIQKLKEGENFRISCEKILSKPYQSDFLFK